MESKSVQKMTFVLIGDGEHTTPVRNTKGMKTFAFNVVKGVPYNDMPKYMQCLIY